LTFNNDSKWPSANDGLNKNPKAFATTWLTDSTP
jgi:hypothetical protein